ncbi:hypothetical protein [Streptomyces sp. NBC_00470]|uniref:hypothetical protein n=1 Tax=Streptomyces sp. NBC_00470 TaxID=2975753 RepID=UPI0030E0021C
MPAFFPREIRNWPTHVDQRDPVMAEHVNEIQAEVASVETVLGTMPHQHTDAYGETVTYPDVDYRLDAMDREYERLDHNQGLLLDAEKNGWNLPLGNFRAPGTSVPPTFNQDDPNDPEVDWWPLKWTDVVSDKWKMRGSDKKTFVCPKTGWWTVTAQFMMDIAPGPSTLEHSCFSALRIIQPGASDEWGTGDNWGACVATSGASSARSTPGHLRTSPVYNGPWYKGEIAMFSLRHMDSLRVPNRPKHPNPVGNRKTFGWASFTYVRALPDDQVVRPPWDLDPEGSLYW